MLFNLLLDLCELLVLFRVQLWRTAMSHRVAENFIDLLGNQPDVGLESVICKQCLLQLDGILLRFPARGDLFGLFLARIKPQRRLTIFSHDINVADLVQNIKKEWLGIIPRFDDQFIEDSARGLSRASFDILHLAQVLLQCLQLGHTAADISRKLCL
jgi:hypothetical protein